MAASIDDIIRAIEKGFEKMGGGGAGGTGGNAGGGPGGTGGRSIDSVL